MAQARATAAAFGIATKASWKRRDLLDAVKAGLTPLRAAALGRGPILPGEAPRPFAARVADDALRALADLGAAPAAPELPAFVTRSQQQQQPQQAPAPMVQIGPRARVSAPARLPADISGLLQRFGLSLEGLLTEGLSNAKLAKGAALAWPVILHHLPARSLAAAVAGPEQGPSAPRSRLPGLYELAHRQSVLSLALAHNGCPWASAGCAAGCLAWAGHGGISQTVAAARARRTLAHLAEPHTYARAILWAIARAWARAQAKAERDFTSNAMIVVSLKPKSCTSLTCRTSECGAWLVVTR